jgi:drug/metabolite transporter (DMT)-like permease
LLYAQCWIEARRNGTHLQLVPRIERRHWPRLLLVSVLGATLAPWLGIEGLDLTYAGRAAFWLALAPVLSAAIGYMLHTERIGRLGQVGLVVAGLGAFGLAVDGLAPDRGYWLGDLLLFAALVMAVAELHLIKPLAARYGATPMVTARTIIGGALYVLVASPSLVQQPWLNLGGWTWIAIVAGGIVGVGIGQWVKVRALRAIGPTQVVLYGNLVPLATILIAWATIGTPTSALEIAAGLFIIVGAVCLQISGSPTREGEPPVA